MSATITAEQERLFAAERELARQEALERELEEERQLTEAFFRREEQERARDLVFAI